MTTGEHWPNDDTAPSMPEAVHVELLRAEFERLTIFNRNALNDFIPTGVTAMAELQLKTPYEEYEAAEPSLTQQLKTAMLQRLGLYSDLADVADDSALYSQRFPGDTVVRILPMTRRDGTQVITYLQGVTDGDGNTQFVHARLLSDEHAHEYIELEKDRLEAPALDRQLRELGLDDLVDLKINEKKVALEMFAELKDLTTPVFDLSSLNDIRRRVARAMLPKLDIAPVRRNDKLDSLIADYNGRINAITATNGTGLDWLEEVAEQERAERLELLNQRLASRKQNAWIGAIGMSGVMSVGGGVAGELAAVSMAEISNKMLGFATQLNYEMVTVGMLSGLVFGGSQLLRPLFTRMRSVGRFEAMPKKPAVFQELADERQLAAQYTNQTRPVQK